MKFNIKSPLYNFQHLNYSLLGQLSASIIHDALIPITALSLTAETFNSQNSHTIQSTLFHSQKQIEEFIEIMKGFLYQSEQEKNAHINTKIRNIITLLSYKAHHHEIEIEFLEFDQVYSTIRPMHIYQIVINLLNNAIEASLASKKKKVIIILKQHTDTYTIECKDFGCGIDKKYIKKIFQPRFTTKLDNCGLGLYSVQYIIKKCLHGKIDISSEPQKGSLFSCTLPLRK